MSEKNIQSIVMVAASQAGAVIFRNNVGVAIAVTPPPKGSWKALVQAVIGYVKRLRGSASLIKFGLCEGSSDLIGWKSVVVTQADVGRTLAVFVALEVKDKGKPSDEQLNFINAVRSAGGIAAVVRSPDEAVAAMNGGLV